MQIKVNIQDDVAIIELKGKMMGGPETTEIHTKVKELVEKDIKKIIIDLGKVAWMNSSGLGVLMGSLTTLRNANGDLKLARVTDKVKSLFMITKLITIFETTETIEEALESFSK